MKVYTQTQRGQYVSGDVGSNGDDDGGGGVNLYACVRVSFFRFCAT